MLIRDQRFEVCSFGPRKNLIAQEVFLIQMRCKICSWWRFVLQDFVNLRVPHLMSPVVQTLASQRNQADGRNLNSQEDNLSVA